MPGTFSPAFFVLGAILRELSIFIDESGSDGLKDRYYLLTLVLHEQDADINEGIRAYERSLAEKGLPDIPFHASPLLNGHGDYSDMELADRKRLLSSFRVLRQFVTSNGSNPTRIATYQESILFKKLDKPIDVNCVLRASQPFVLIEIVLAVAHYLLLFSSRIRCAV